MYERLIAFLLGKNMQFTDDDLNEFIDLLNAALEITSEYELHKKQAIIENMVKRAKVTDRQEIAVITSAIDNILQLEEDDGDDIELLDDKSDSDTLLRSKKFVRGIKTHKETKRARSRDKRRSKHPEHEEGDGQPSLGPGRSLDETDKSHKTKKIRVQKSEAAETELQNEDCETKDSFIGQEDLLKSTANPIEIPQKVVVPKSTIISNHPENPNLSFRKLFAAAPHTTGRAVVRNKSTLEEIYNTSDLRETRESSEFKFDLGELHENHNDGPDVEFNTEESD